HTYKKIAMDDAITVSTPWLQSCDSFPLSEATTASISVENTLPSPNKPCRGIDHKYHQHQLSPKSSGCVSKPIRRRSRASKRTPTARINANTSNVRSLVQQFTGCPRSSSISFATQKGPITLNFGAGIAHNCGSSTNFLEKFHGGRENCSQRNKQQQQ